MKNFAATLVSDIDYFLKSTDLSTMCISDFLKSLSDESFNYYHTFFISIISENPPEDMDFNNAIFFYSEIYRYIEKGPIKPYSEIFDDDGMWFIRTTQFFRMESFRREKLISDYDGFLDIGVINIIADDNWNTNKDIIFSRIFPDEIKWYKKLFHLD